MRLGLVVAHLRHVAPQAFQVVVFAFFGREDVDQCRKIIDQHPMPSVFAFYVIGAQTQGLLHFLFHAAGYTHDMGSRIAVADEKELSGSIGYAGQVEQDYVQAF